MNSPDARPSRLGVLLLAVGVTALAIFGGILVPKLLTAAHAGQGPVVLNRAIAWFQRGQPRPIERYLSVWSEICLLLVGLGSASWFLTTRTARRCAAAFTRRFVEPCTPGTLGAIRCLVFSLLLFSVIVEDLPSIVHLPDEVRSGMGFLKVLDFLPGRAYLAFHHSPAALFAFQAVTTLVLTMGALGLRTRLTVPLGAACYFVFGGMLREHSHFYHAYLLALYLATALAFMPCGDGWSLDRFLRIARGKPVFDGDATAEIYGWCRMICWTLIAVTYTLAGLSKLSNGGLGWISADTIRDIHISDSLNPTSLPVFPQEWGLGLGSLDLPDQLLSGMAAMAMVGEFFYFLVLFSPWARRIFPALMASMHVGIILFQRLFFFDSIVLQAIFYDWRAGRLWLGRKLERRGASIRVTLDPLEPESPRVEAALHDLDFFDLLRFHDPSVEPIVPIGPFPIASTADGRVHVGPDAVRRIASCLPFTRPFSIVAGRPWAISLASRAWRGLAGRAGRGESAGLGVPIAPARRTPEFAFFASMVFYCVISFVNWKTSREIYPISGWGMYSGSNTDGKTHYFKVLAHYEDGRVEPAPIGRWIGVMREARYKDYIFGHFVRKDPWSDRRILAKFFEACMTRANALAPPGSRVIGIEAQSWEWSLHDPTDRPTRGKMVDQYYQTAPK